MYLRRLIGTLTLIALVATGCTSSDQEPEPPDLVPDSKLLPSPLPFPVGDPDEAAASLAAEVLQGGDGGTAALLTAISGSGIAVVDAARDEEVTLKAAEPNLGLAFEAGEVVAMSRLLAADYQLRLDDLADIYTHLAPAEAHMERAPVDRFITSGIQAAALDKDLATHRFWGRFILELAQQSGEPLDPGNVPGSTTLNAVQVFFLLLRTAGDYRTLALNGGTVAPLALAIGEVMPMLAPELPATAADPPCNLSEEAAQVLDVTGVSLSYGAEKYIHLVAENLGHGSALGTYAKAIPFINGALAWIKFIAVRAAFEGHIELKGGSPLTRRRDKPPGEQRELIVTLRMNTGQATFLNCLRTMINLAGLDISLPNDGPIPDARVDWSLLKGGDIVRFCAEGCRHPGNAVLGVTNEEGEVSTWIEGLPRPRVIPASASEVTKQVFVRVAVTLKRANMFRDIWDAIATVLVGGPGAAGVFPTELLYRGWGGAFGAGLKFNVIDYGERWKIDMRLVVQGSGSNLVSTWNGYVDVDPATGDLTGQGTGSLNGHQSVCFSLNTLLYYRINLDANGSYSVSFGGTKEGDHFDLEVRGVDPDVRITGNLVAACEFVRQENQEGLEAVAVDPGLVFGVDVFSFDGGGTYIFRHGFGNGTAELKLTATQLTPQ